MKKIVFYSWQSDLSNGTNRNLIEDALKHASKEIQDDETVDIEPVIDRDTQGIAGAPNIATAIFKKIDSSDLFVADVSIIGTTKRRATPNPNVLIELGYALKVLGHERIILVFNTTFGKVEKLPFDLKMHRILTYQCAESVIDRSEIKKNLIKDLKSALLAGFSHVIPKKVSIPVIDIIKNNTPSKKIELRAHLVGVLNDLEKLQPKMYRDGGTVEDLLLAIPKTESLVIEFAELSNTVVLMNDSESAKEIFQWFGKILTKYNPPVNENNRGFNVDGDFFKFLGHELFVVFITPFLREEKLKELQEILKVSLRVGSKNNRLNETKESWTELGEYSPLLADESKKRNPKRISLQADLLKNRYEKEKLSKVVPFKDFMETDFFLSLYGEGSTKEDYYYKWYPHSVIYMKNTPVFLSETVDYSKAIQLCHTLGISEISELKKRLTCAQKFSTITFRAITNDVIKSVGSKGGGALFYPD